MSCVLLIAWSSVAQH